jgi:hypothetical protein
VPQAVEYEGSAPTATKQLARYLRKEAKEMHLLRNLISTRALKQPLSTQALCSAGTVHRQRDWLACKIMQQSLVATIDVV